MDAATSARKVIAGRGQTRERFAARRTNDAKSAFAKASADGYQARRKPLALAAAYGKSVWFWHPLLVSSCRRQMRSNRIVSAIKSAVTVARRIRRREERAISRKTIAWGMPECFRFTCMLVCVSSHNFAHETAGAARTRHSLLPLFFFGGRVSKQTSRGSCGEIVKLCLMQNSQRRPGERRDPYAAALRLGAAVRQLLLQ